MDMIKFAERLRYIRQQRNISVEELAEAIKLNRSTISRYETAGFKSIKEETLNAISKYLLVTKEYLIGETDDKYSVTSLESLSKKETIEINNVIYLTKEIIKQKNVTLEGKPINETNIDYLIDSMELALEMLKRKNKSNT